MAYDKVVDSEQLDAGLQVIADAIRRSAGITSGLQFPSGFVNAIEPLGNGHDYLASVCNKEITELVNSKMLYLPGGDFQKNNKKLVKVDLPLVTFVRAGTFNGCNNLSIVNLPSVTKTDASCFESCQSLKKLYLPSLQTIEGWGWTFNNCQYLERVYFPVFTGTITSSSFEGNKRLATLILGSDTVVSLQSTGVFTNTPIKSGTGYIYVKRALVDSYKSATNWSTFANQFNQYIGADR